MFQKTIDDLISISIGDSQGVHDRDAGGVYEMHIGSTGCK